EVTRGLVEDSEDAGLWASHGWLLLQAEQRGPARAAFERALRHADGRADEASIAAAANAALGLANLYARDYNIGGAERMIREASQAVGRGSLGPRYEAQVEAANARVQFEQGRYAEAEAQAKKALERDPRCSLAHLVLADVAQEQRGDVEAHLKRAVESPGAVAEAIG